MKKVEATTTIHADPATVIKAFTDAGILKAWWGVEGCLIEAKPGGAYTLVWQVTEKGFGYVTTGVIQSYQPENELVVGCLVYLNPERQLLGPMILTVRATPVADGTELYLCQDGYQTGGDWDWYYAAVKEAWPMVLPRLKKVLEEEES